MCENIYFGGKVVGYMGDAGDAGYMGDEYQARASLGRGTDIANKGGTVSKKAPLFYSFTYYSTDEHDSGSYPGSVNGHTYLILLQSWL